MGWCWWVGWEWWTVSIFVPLAAWRRKNTRAITISTRVIRTKFEDVYLGHLFPFIWVGVGGGLAFMVLISFDNYIYVSFGFLAVRARVVCFFVGLILPGLST